MERQGAGQAQLCTLLLAQALEPAAHLCLSLTLKVGDSQFHECWHLHPQHAASSQPLWDFGHCEPQFCQPEEPSWDPCFNPYWPCCGVTSMFLPFQEDRRESKLTLRPPSLAAPYAPVQNWQHQPEKLIFESCGYEANVSGFWLVGVARTRRLWGQVVVCGVVNASCSSLGDLSLASHGCWPLTGPWHCLGFARVSCVKPLPSLPLPNSTWAPC